MLDLLVFLGFHFLLAALALIAWGALAGEARSRGAGLARGFVSFFGALVVAMFAASRLSEALSVQTFGRIVSRVETSDSLIALTFDDGPTPTGTETLLPLLEARGVRATFFLTGKGVEYNLPAARAIVRAGHEVGNHSYSHAMLFGIPTGRIRNEIALTDRQIARTGYAGPVHFRSPYGKKFVSLPWVLSRMDRTNVTWDVAPDNDPAMARRTDLISAHVLENTRPGSIILLHVMEGGRRASMNALPEIIDGLQKRGYRFVTVSELMRHRA